MRSRHQRQCRVTFDEMAEFVVFGNISIAFKDSHQSRQAGASFRCSFWGWKDESVYGLSGDGRRPAKGCTEVEKQPRMNIPSMLVITICT